MCVFVLKLIEPGLVCLNVFEYVFVLKLLEPGLNVFECACGESYIDFACVECIFVLNVCLC
jgi:hypothetical protein